MDFKTTLWSNCQKIPLFFTTWHLHICFCIFASWNRQNAFNGHSLFQPHIKGAVLRTSRTNIFETPTGKKRLKICIKQNFNAKFFIYAKHKMHTFLNINGEETTWKQLTIFMQKMTYRILIAMTAFSKSSGKITPCLDLKNPRTKNKKKLL